MDDCTKKYYEMKKNKIYAQYDIEWAFFLGSWLNNTQKIENQLPKIWDFLSTVFQPSRDWWWT
jgi:hypothetical protein